MCVDFNKLPGAFSYIIIPFNLPFPLICFQETQINMCLFQCPRWDNTEGLSYSHLCPHSYSLYCSLESSLQSCVPLNVPLMIALVLFLHPSPLRVRVRADTGALFLAPQHTPSAQYCIRSRFIYYKPVI